MIIHVKSGQGLKSRSIDSTTNVSTQNVHNLILINISERFILSSYNVVKSSNNSRIYNNPRQVRDLNLDDR